MSRSPPSATTPVPASLRPVLPWLELRVREGPMHLTLIDPDKTPGEEAGRVAQVAAGLGSDAVLLGGSTGITRARMGEAAAAVRRMAGLRTIIFPQGPESITPEADALLFMSLLNSRDIGMIIRAQARSALAIQKIGLEPISLGYLVIAPGMKVGEVGQADCIPREDLAGAAGYALAAQMFGMRLLYLEAGSGAPAPVPAAMIREVRKTVHLPLIVGGGIRQASDARTALDAGADILVTGTVVEDEGGAALAPILREVKRPRGGGH